MAGFSDDDAHAATMSPATDPSGATLAASAESRAPAGDTADESTLGAVDPASYVRGKTLAVGGMGRIVAARDRRLGRSVAIKEIRGGSAELRARFAREVRITARLQHPNIITVHEAGTWPDGEPFFAMKLVAGRSLDKVVAERATFEARLALLPSVIAVADALAYAHRDRVIHRDLKPANVLVGDFGETVVIDWGLAKDLAADDDIADARDGAGPYRASATASGGETAFGAVLGTPAYMPPEQARGESVDARADVYALGALLYHVLCGAPPVEGNSAQEVLTRVIAAPVVSPRVREPRVPLELDTIIVKAMAPAAADRYPTAVELAEDLRRFQTGQLVGAHRYTTWQLVRRWMRKHRTPIAIASIAAALLAIGGTWGLVHVVHARDEARASAESADASMMTMLIESGRNEVLAKHPLRALALLSEAYTRGARSDDLRYLLGRVVPYADTVLQRFGDGVTSAAYTPDGQHILIASNDGKIREWSADATTVERTFDVAAPSTPIHLGHDAKLALIGPDAELAVVDLGSGHVSGRSRAHDYAFDPTGERAWRIDDLIRVDRAGASHMLSDRWGATFLGARAYGADLVFVTPTEIVHLRDTDTDLVTVERHAHGVKDALTAAISGDLQHVVVAASAHLGFRRVDGTVVSDEEGAIGDSFALDQDGSHLATVTTYAQVALTPWIGDQIGRSSYIALPADAEVTSLVFSADGSHLIAVNPASSLYVVDVRRRAFISRLSAEVAISRAEMSPDGRRVLAALIDGSAQLWDVSVPRELPTVSESVRCATYDAQDHVVAFRFSGVEREDRSDVLDAEAHGTHCAIDPTRRWIAVTTEDAIHVIDLAHDTAPPVAIPTGGEPPAVAVTREGHRVLALLGDGSLAVFDDGARTATWRAPAGTGRPDGLQLAPDGTRAAVLAPGGGRVLLFDTRDGRVITLSAPDLLRSRWSDDGSRFATAGGDGVVRIWDANDGHLIASYAHVSAVGDVAFAPDPRVVYTAAADGAVREWSEATPAQPARVLRVARGVVERIAIDPAHGRLFATVSRDTARRVALWSVATGELVAELVDGNADSEPIDLVISRDGTRLLAVPQGRSVSQWNLEPDAHSAAEIHALVARVVPWVIKDGRLVVRPR